MWLSGDVKTGYNDLALTETHTRSFWSWFYPHQLETCVRVWRPLVVGSWGAPPPPPWMISVRLTSTPSLHGEWYSIVLCTHWAYVRTHSLSHHCLSTSSVIEPNSSPTTQSNTKTCSREYQTQRHPLLLSLYAPEFTVCPAAVFVCVPGEEPRFCDCAAFCNSASKRKSQTSCLSSYVCTAISSWNYLCI